MGIPRHYQCQVRELRPKYKKGSTACTDIRLMIGRVSNCFNPLTVKLFILNFHRLKVVSR